MTTKFNNFAEFSIMGQVATEPEMKYLDDGKAITNFSVPFHKYEGKDPNTNKSINSTMWINVTAWEKDAEMLYQFLHKGDTVLVKGSLNFDKATGGPSTYQDKTGNTKASFQVSANSVTIVSKATNAAGYEDGSQNGQAQWQQPNGIAPAPAQQQNNFVPQQNNFVPQQNNFVPQQNTQQQQQVPQNFAPKQNGFTVNQATAQRPAQTWVKK